MLDQERKDLGPDYHDHGVLFCWPDGRPPHPVRVGDLRDPQGSGEAGDADLGKLPSDPMALVRWAMRPPGGGGHYTTADFAWNAFNGIEGTLMSYVLPPKVAAELYRALGDIPGVTVDKDAVDAAGRHGPAFVLTDKDYPGGGWTAEVFLNPHTFQLTGYAEHFPDKCACPSPGTGGTAILRQALVPGPGVRP